MEQNNQLLFETYYLNSASMEIIGNRELTYLYAGGTPFAIQEKNGNDEQLYYLHLDYQGSIRAITDEAGAVVETRDYDAWGRPRNANTLEYTATNPFSVSTITNRGYTFHEHIYEFSLINMNARMYDPVLRRVISPDNYIQAPDNTQSFNRYSYCWNNPLKYTDPDGNIITWNVSRNGFSIGLNFTPVGVPLGFGVNIGWGNGASAGVYGEVGYRVGGTGFGKGATVSQSIDYNFRYNTATTTTSATVYASFGAINSGANVSKTYNLTTGQWAHEGLNWSVSIGLGVGTDRAGLGINLSYGSSGWGYGIGGYYDPNAPSAFQKTETVEVPDNSTASACETCPPELKEASANLATITVIAIAEPTFFGEIALAAYASYVTLRYGPDAVKGAMTYMQWKGERGWQGKSQNTDNPYKYWRNHPSDPNKVMKPDRNGNLIATPKPPDWSQWKRPDGGNKSKKR